MPQKYPWVFNEIKKTPRTNIIGIRVLVSNMSCIQMFKNSKSSSVIMVNRASFMFNCSFIVMLHRLCIHTTFSLYHILVPASNYFTILYRIFAAILIQNSHRFSLPTTKTGRTSFDARPAINHVKLSAGNYLPAFAANISYLALASASAFSNRYCARSGLERESLL